MSARGAGALRWAVRKGVSALAVLLGAATLSFVAMQLIPGDPARALVGSAPATPETMAAVRHEMGLDLPLPLRYLHYLGRLARFDLGRSYQLQEPVSTVIGDQIVPTAQLAFSALGFALVFALLTAGLTAGRWRGFGRLVQGVELLLVSTPGFWLGMMLLAVLSFRWHLFPVAGASGVQGLVLPAATLGAPLGAVLSQVLRTEIETALRQPFAMSVRARGVGPSALRMRHLTRHGVVPVATLSGWLLGGLLGGAVLVETVFARPGLGRVTLEAVTGRDFPVVSALVMLLALVFVTVNTLVDAVCRIADPRLRAA